MNSTEMRQRRRKIGNEYEKEEMREYETQYDDDDCK